MALKMRDRARFRRRTLGRMVMLVLAGGCVLGVGLLALGFLLLSSGLPLSPNDRAIQQRIRCAVPPGSSLASTRQYLSSPRFQRFLQAHGYLADDDDAGTAYSDGKSLTVTEVSDPYGSTLHLQFQFDRHGGLSHITLRSQWAGF